ncbi:hypothetical protein GMD78_05220 [Ornithinibacillus sp. L9]|uniref:Uncharacterized protein n=1 Tax=Ornithinibacillus caprae TaxID=2678566 RepID=A0A6N8FF40_9BACI|nr:hypothetical protein [Ornithinibacillus caprae]MUK87801.1 hypothetical protein [Ornithinibacillus caprae]
MHEKMRQLEFPVVGKTYISKSRNSKYNKVKVLEHKEDIYKLTGGESPVSLVIYKVLEPMDAKDNIDIEISDYFYANYRSEKSLVCWNCKQRINEG